MYAKFHLRMFRISANQCLLAITHAGAGFLLRVCVSQLEGALLPKSQRKQEFFYAPTKGKHAKEHEKKKEKPKMLKYDVGTLAYFEQCGVCQAVGRSSSREQKAATLLNRF